MTYQRPGTGRRAEIGAVVQNRVGMADSLAYRVFLEPDDDGFRAIVPAFPRIFTGGDTVEEALLMAKDAIELEIAVARERGEEPPEPDGDLDVRIERVVVNPAA